MASKMACVDDEQVGALEREVMLTVEFMSAMADRLDGWADQSERGGWSTHQVRANREAANDLRRRAAKLRKGMGL